MYVRIIPTWRQREIKHKNDVGTEVHELIWLVTIDYASQSATLKAFGEAAQISYVHLTPMPVCLLCSGSRAISII